MELHDAIKTIVDTFGKDIIAERRFLNAIADYYSFRDNPAGKIVLSTLVNGGYMNRFLGNPSDIELTIIISQIENEVYNNFGFRKEVIDNIINSLIRGLNLTIQKDPRNDKTSAFCDVTPEVDSHNTIHTPQTPTIHTQIAGNDLSYSEDYIMSLFPVLFYNVPPHAHMDFDIFQKKLQMDSDEAFQLFKFLKGMGVYIFNVNSDDYDIKVDSEDTLRKLYRDYIIQKRILNIPISNGKTLERKYLEAITKILYYKKCISVEEIDSELFSIHDNKWFAIELYDILQRVKLIDNYGHSLNPYLTPEYMANCIVNHVMLKNKPHLFSLLKMEKGMEHLLKLKFTNVALLVKNLQTDDNKAAVVLQKLIQTKIINDKGALINPYLGVKAIAEKVWEEC